MGDTLIRDAAVLRDIAPADAAICAGLARAVGWPRRAGSAGRLPVTTRGFGCVHLCVDFGGEAGGAPPR